MSLKVWNGSAYVAANFAKIDAKTPPKAAYIWTGSSFKRVWPDITYTYLYTDTFDRANAALGADWGLYAGTLRARVVSNIAQSAAVASATGRQGAGWEVYQGGANGGSLDTDDFRIKATMDYGGPGISSICYTSIFASAGTPYTNTANRMLAVVMGGWSGTLGCKLMVIGGNQTAVGGSMPTTTTGTNTLLDTSSEIVDQGDIIEFTRTGSFVQVLKNGAEILSATTTIPLVGTANRRWGVVLEAEFPVLQQQYGSPGINKIEAGVY